jgi:hypothetical protein
MKPKYEYGQTLEIASVDGIDLPSGTIVIRGLMQTCALAREVDWDCWLIGDSEFDYDIQTQPFYFFDYIEGGGFYEDEVVNLPEFALSELVEKAKRIKTEKCKKEILKLIGM